MSCSLQDVAGLVQSEIEQSLKDRLQLAGGLLPLPEETSIKEETRHWTIAKFSGFRESANSLAICAEFWAQRSDGRFFRSMVSVFPAGPRWPDVHSAEPLKKLFKDKANEAIENLATFRDCSCGVIGHKWVKDEDGEDALVGIHHPCRIHKPEDGVSIETRERKQE